LAKFRKLMEEKMALLHIDPSFATRYVNEGFSGGEKKRLEMLQMAVVGPRMAILDETDSGLDIDALRNVAEGINASLSPETGVLLITHYQRMLNYVKPQFVHVLLDGRVVMSGGEELSHQLEANGYDWVREQVGLPAGVGDAAAEPAEPAEPVAEHV
jgi:Fe-S cluster assembly ATP-binding protein